MTLSILHTEASLGWGGQEIRILTEAAGLIRRGHKVRLACPADARIFSEAPGFGVPVEALPIGRKKPSGVLALRRHLSARRYDAINTHSSTDSWLAALACAGLASPPPIVRTRHLSARVPRNLASRWLYRNATREIVTTGEAIREQLIRDVGVEARRVVSIPTGVDLSLYRPGDRKQARAGLELPDAALLIGIVATLRSWKGHRYLLEAFSRLGRRDAQLLVVGDGPQREALAGQAAELGIQDRVTFAGNRSPVAPWLQSLDIFALPSYANEGVPQALVQAMATGLPCVTTAAGAIPELARDEDNALVVPMQDASALAAALARLLDDGALRARLGDAARRAAGQFDIEGMLDRMEALFLRVTGKGA
jgi:glycosyltransferase involved in cell wall biosynthesis